LIFAALVMLVLAAIALPMAIIAMAKIAPKQKEPSDQEA
jgi:hypothetical protein